MEIYNGNVEVTKCNQEEWMAKLNRVTTITGYVWAYNAKISLPVCENVGSAVWAYNSGEITLPVCENVGGEVWADNAKITLPEKYEKNPKPTPPIRFAFAKRGYLFADNILSRIISKRKAGKCFIYKTSKIGNRKKIIYVVQKGEIFSHGDTIKQASHDLRYKLSDRDTTKYKGWTFDTIKPIADIIGAYRAITGACETGTKQFCEGKKLPERLSVKVAIRLTKGAYRAEQFAAFFKGGVK